MSVSRQVCVFHAVCRQLWHCASNQRFWVEHILCSRFNPAAGSNLQEPLTNQSGNTYLYISLLASGSLTSGSFTLSGVDSSWSICAWCLDLHCDVSKILFVKSLCHLITYAELLELLPECLPFIIYCHPAHSWMTSLFYFTDNSLLHYKCVKFMLAAEYFLHKSNRS